MDYSFMSQEEEKASENPLMLMLDDNNGNKYMRAVGKKGVDEGNDMDWLIIDMHKELKAWGYPGGGDDEVMLKSDGELTIRAVRERLSRYHGGKITQNTRLRGQVQATDR